MDYMYSSAKASHGKINLVSGGPVNNVRKINCNGNADNGGAHGQVAEKASVTEEETASPTTIMQDDNNESNYKKIMHALHQHPKEGLGIVEFLKGKNLFITGATGFLGKGVCAF